MVEEGTLPRLRGGQYEVLANEFVDLTIVSKELVLVEEQPPNRRV